MAPKCSAPVRKKAKELKKYRWLQPMQIAFNSKNPKWAGCKAWKRYEKYRNATSVKSAMDCGASLKDLDNDYGHGFLVVHGEQPSVIQKMPVDDERGEQAELIQKQEREHMPADDEPREQPEMIQKQEREHMPLDDEPREQPEMIQKQESEHIDDEPREHMPVDDEAREEPAHVLVDGACRENGHDLPIADADPQTPGRLSRDMTAAVLGKTMSSGTQTSAAACLSVGTQTDSSSKDDEVMCLTHEVFFWRGKCERARLCTKPSNAMTQRHTRLCRGSGSIL